MFNSNFFEPSKDELVMDFLICLSKSPFRKFLALKGARNLDFFLKDQTGEGLMRQTEDVDIHARTENDWNQFLEFVESSFHRLSPKGIKYSVELHPNGRRVYIGFNSYSFKLQVDMNISSEWIQFPSHGKLGLLGYPLGFMLADKIKVLTSPKIYRRAKDLYDIYVISSSINISLSDVKKDFLTKYKPNEDLDFVLDVSTLRHAYEKLRMVIDKPTFEEVYDRVSLFAYPLLEYVLEGTTLEYKWDKNVGGWYV